MSISLRTLTAGDGAHATEVDEERDDGDGEEHRDVARDLVEAGDLDDDAESGELNLQIGNDEEDAEEGDEEREDVAAISLLEEIGLSLKAMAATQLPDVGKDVERTT